MKPLKSTYNHTAILKVGRRLPAALINIVTDLPAQIVCCTLKKHPARISMTLKSLNMPFCAMLMNATHEVTLDHSADAQ